MNLTHITLLTGDVVRHRLDTLLPEAVAACRLRLLPTGGGPVPGFPAFRVEIHDLVFTIYRGREPLVSCGIGHGAEPDGQHVWSALCELQARFAPVKATAPTSGPWLAVVILPSLINTARSDIAWLADFERCLAAAMILPPPCTPSPASSPA